MIAVLLPSPSMKILAKGATPSSAEVSVSVISMYILQCETILHNTVQCNINIYCHLHMAILHTV